MQLFATLTLFIDFTHDADPVAQNCCVVAGFGVQGGDVRVLDFVVCRAAAVIHCRQVSEEEAGLVLGLTILPTGHIRDHFLGMERQISDWPKSQK